MTYKQMVIRSMLYNLLVDNKIPMSWAANLGHGYGPMAAGDLAIEYVETVWRPAYVDDQDLNEWIQKILSEISATFCCQVCSEQTWQLRLDQNKTLVCHNCLAVGNSPVLAIGTGLEPTIG